MFCPNLAQISAVVFDLDGTLVKTPKVIVEYANEARAELGFDTRSTIEIMNSVGKSPNNFWSDIPNLNENDEKRLTSLFREKMDSHPFTEKSLYPAVQELLTHLHEMEIKLAIASNKPESNAKLLLEKCGILEFFSVVKGGDKCPEKPNPQMLNQISHVLKASKPTMVMIGDRVDDMKCARNAKVTGIGLTQSVETEESLLNAGATLVFKNVAKLSKSLIGERTTLEHE